MRANGRADAGTTDLGSCRCTLSKDDLIDDIGPPVAASCYGRPSKRLDAHHVGRSWARSIHESFLDCASLCCILGRVRNPRRPGASSKRGRVERRGNANTSQTCGGADTARVPAKWLTLRSVAFLPTGIIVQLNARFGSDQRSRRARAARHGVR
jgi:hypothetical protein